MTMHNIVHCRLLTKNRCTHKKALRSQKQLISPHTHRICVKITYFAHNLDDKLGQSNLT